MRIKLFWGFLAAAVLLLIAYYLISSNPSVSINNYSLVAGIILILMAIVQFWLILNSVLGPLKILIKEASILAKGKLETFSYIKRQDELGTLEYYLNLITKSWQKDLIEKSEDVKSAQKHIRETFSRLSQALSSVLDLGELLTLILDIAKEELRLDKVILYLVDSKTGEMQFKQGRGLNSEQKEYSQEKWLEAALIVAQKQKILQGEAEKTFPPLVSLATDKKSYVVVSPLIVKQEVNGIIIGQRKEKLGKFSLKDMELLATLTNQAAIGVENASLYEQTQKLAVTDGLTQLYNHRVFQERLIEEIARAERMQNPLALLMIDIDHFKKYNDTFGHPQGDIVLKEVAKILMKSTRLADFTARYGGEEFVIILPETSKDGAQLLAERILLATKKHKFPGKNLVSPVKMSVSIGVTVFPREATTPEELIKKADTKLYEAKKQGRDKVVA